MNDELILPIGGHAPAIDEEAFVAPMTTLIGRVSVGPASSVFYGSVLRGDNDDIIVGERCNIQDGCILHADPGYPVLLGDGVSLGHGAVVHGSKVADNVLVGMRATVLNGCEIGSYSIIGAGAVVRENSVIPPRSLVVGVPGRIIREVSDEECARIERTAANYVRQSARHREALRELGSQN